VRGDTIVIILGLHFGHDAAIAVLRDGELLLCVERERLSRVKHAMALHPDDIKRCLDDVGIGIDDVDYCALTTTQDFEYVFLDADRLRISLSHHPQHTAPCTLVTKLGYTPERMLASGTGSLREIFDCPTHRWHAYRKLLPGCRAILDDDKNLLPSFEKFLQREEWNKRLKLSEIAATDYRDLLDDDARYGFHYPATVHFEGRAIPAYLIAHHCAHACYSFFESPYPDAAILSHDGGETGKGYESGFFAYGTRNVVYLYAPHSLNIGDVYTEAAETVGFGVIEGPGKLMGLSAYGRPTFFDPRFVGNWQDMDCLPPRAWIDHCVSVGAKIGYDLVPLGDTRRTLDPINVDIAASTQRLLEETMLAATESLWGSLQRSGISSKHLCLTGGVALNCPANTRIANESPFSSVFVPPAVSDSGLAIGAAYALYHNVLDQPRRPPTTCAHRPGLAYRGLCSSAGDVAIARALSSFGGRLTFEKCADSALAAAECLQRNQIIGWFQARSELGPRALGHRSILANPTIHENWRRVNLIKGRELWRPLAPSALDDAAATYFSGVPMPSYFMLMNATVVDPQGTPATSHVDRSARIQCVTPDCGRFYALIQNFHRLSGIPIVLNTSFNGPGVPIVEQPEEAIEFLLNSTLDALFIEDYRVTRRQQ
jgi:carbamoyltransferase